MIQLCSVVNYFKWGMFQFKYNAAVPLGFCSHLLEDVCQAEYQTYCILFCCIENWRIMISNLPYIIKTIWSTCTNTLTLAVTEWKFRIVCVEQSIQISLHIKQTQILSKLHLQTVCVRCFPETLCKGVHCIYSDCYLC